MATPTHTDQSLREALGGMRSRRADPDSTRARQLRETGTYSRVLIERIVDNRSRVFSIQVEVPDEVLHDKIISMFAKNFERFLSDPKLSGPTKIRAIASFLEQVAEAKGEDPEATNTTGAEHRVSGGRALDLS